MNKKNILITLLVIVAGLILGAILSTSLPEKYTSPKQQSPSIYQEQPVEVNNPGNQSNNAIPTNKIGLVISANPSQLKPFPASVDFHKNWVNISKATLTISYQNKSKTNLTGLQAWITHSPNQLLYSGTETANQDNAMTSKSGKIVYNIPDIKAGKSKTAEIIIFSSKPNQYKISVDIHTNNNETASSSPIIFTVR